ncbi:MAG TPA: response regulator [Chloroflexota bacterium]
MDIAPAATCNIVVVDDEPELLDLLRDILEDEGHEVVAVSDPGDVKAMQFDGGPDLFLLDLMLPGMDGIELASQLRLAGFDRTPIIAMSASAAMLTAARNSHLFQETLAKPFDLSTLLAFVERYSVA